MEVFLVTLLAKGRRVQVYIRSESAQAAFQVCKILYPSAFVIKSEKASAHKRIG